MRKFIVSDLHGNGNMYNIIMSYLKRIKNYTDEDITLYINGDLIDRGWDSAEILIDVKNRILNGSDINIEYLGGNHELLMWQTFPKIEKGRNPFNSLWFDNGGDTTFYCLEDEIEDEEEFFEMFRFVSNLKLYHKFNETINDKNIVLAHSKCPKEVKDICDLKIIDNNHIVKSIVWSRKEDFFSPTQKIGNKNYFTIIGHTPLKTSTGFKYFENENYMNVDGGNSGYVLGYEEYNHTPLVEIDSKNNRLIILTFNNNNEIIKGNYFIENRIVPIENLDSYRKYIDNNIKVKKLVREDGMVFFR